MVRPVLVGNVSGATGDRQDAMLQMLTGAIKVDAIVGDWLSEMNLSWRAFDYEQDKTKGYEIPFLNSFKLAVHQFVDANVKLIVNAGAFNPKQLSIEVGNILDGASTKGKVKVVAWLEGDNILPSSKKYANQFIHLSNGRTLKDWGKEPVSANAYLGAWGIVRALQEGSDIVITGRVTDASPLIAAAAWWHNWKFDEFDKLAQVLVAGHLIECGPYVTGGNFPGFKSLMPNYFDLSFPIAEIHGDGTSIITKHPDQNGLVSIETVTTQFLYELQGPYYFNPDVIADCRNITFSSLGFDRVRLANIRGLPPPPTLKVAVQAHGGYQAEFSLHPVGLDISTKVESFKEMTNRILQEDLQNGRISVLEYQLYGLAAEDPTSQPKATTQLRVFIQAPKAETVSKVCQRALSNALSGFPGFSFNMDFRTATPKPFMDFWPGLAPRSFAPQTVHFLRSQKTFHVDEAIPLLAPTDVPAQPSHDSTDPVPMSRFGPTVRAPLGHIVYARSGDKGPNVNVGFFCAGANATQETTKWAWLRSFFTISRLRALLGDDNPKDDKIERCEFPGIGAVHFVIHGVLGGGVGSTSKLDSLGKGVAEFLRARVVDIPVQFYNPHAKI